MKNEEGHFESHQIDACLLVLEALVENRLLLSSIPEEKRKPLLMAAGKVSRPDKLQQMKLGKIHRRLLKRKERTEDRKKNSETGIRVARQASVFKAPTALPLETRDSAKELNQPRHCYVCKTSFTRLHFFYDSMCTACGDFNYSKRYQTASLDGKVALITGSRLKIGYQSTLLLLRAGATVIATTRFPNDSAKRFSQEEDFSQWSHRLHIYGLDLRHCPSVERFAAHICDQFDRLDILINNAAQTVRRPPGFYRHLLEAERNAPQALPPLLQPVLGNYWDWKVKDPSLKSLMALEAPALMSQLNYSLTDGQNDKTLFPENQLDADLQQVDLRAKNSWRMVLSEVSTPELLEVTLVNSIAPFILCGKLKPLMLRQPNRDKHIVNVSAMEGKFTRYTKTDKHPHTNMAKASLNMMTVTAAMDYIKDGIHMNAVDTGWVTDEDPAHLSQEKHKMHDFEPPLDIVDGAARVCDPIFSGLITGEHVHGKFLKDYFPTTW